jgi:hypothetical protein
MKISKAIEILDYLHKSHEFEWSPDTESALKLVREALKRIQNARAIGHAVPGSLLPGEEPE